MPRAFLFKTAFTVSVVTFLTACSSVQKQGVFSQAELAEQNIHPQFSRALEREEWLANEYRKYLSTKGNKAFAVYWDAVGFPLASGYGDDKLTMTIARKEALRLCQAYSRSQQERCVVESEEATHREPLDPASFPEEVIAYRDVAHWQQYLSTPGHKAIVGNPSGIKGGSKGESQADAEQKALAQCQEKASDISLGCYIIASE